MVWHEILGWKEKSKPAVGAIGAGSAPTAVDVIVPTPSEQPSSDTRATSSTVPASTSEPAPQA